MTGASVTIVSVKKNPILSPNPNVILTLIKRIKIGNAEMNAHYLFLSHCTSARNVTL